jgi:hypothetical protein
MKPNEFITLGEDYIEISRTDEVVNNEPFDSRIDKSVIESDYSDDNEAPSNIMVANNDEEDDLNDASRYSRQSHRARSSQNSFGKGFMKGCYVTQEVEQDLDYQEVIARRMNAVKEDIRDFESWDWDLFECDLPGVPLKHFVDNWARFGNIEHSEDCPTESHRAYMNDYIAERNNNRPEVFQPEQCPEFPTAWTEWHDTFDIDQLRTMPMKTFFTVDVTNFAVDPMPMQPKSTKNLLNFSTYLVGPNKAIVFNRSEGREFLFAERFAPEFIYEIS